MKHKVRDRVRIRPDLRTDIKYGDYSGSVVKTKI